MASTRDPLLQVHSGRIDLLRATYDLKSAHQLERALIEPLRPLLRGVQRLTVVPDGLLHALSFDALVTHHVLHLAAHARADDRNPMALGRLCPDHACDDCGYRRTSGSGSA